MRWGEVRENITSGTVIGACLVKVKVQNSLCMYRPGSKVSTDMSGVSRYNCCDGDKARDMYNVHTLKGGHLSWVLATLAI